MGEFIVAPKFPQPTHYSVFIRDLKLPCSSMNDVLTLSVGLKVDVPPDLLADRYRFVVCYDRVVQAAKAFADDEEIANLLQLGERIAQRCLDDKRVCEVSIALTPVDEHGSGTGGIELHRARLGNAIHNHTPVRIVANA